MSEDLSFNEHIHVVAGKGKQMAGWALRTFTSRDPFLMKTMLRQVVLSRLEYCCVLWSPTTQNEINVLESVQRFFTKKINFGEGRENLNYWERLRHLKVYSAERRRERYIILYTWKVLHDLYPNPGLSFNVLFPDAHGQHAAHGIHITNFNDRTGITQGHIQASTLETKLKT